MEGPVRARSSRRSRMSILKSTMPDAIGHADGSLSSDFSHERNRRQQRLRVACKCRSENGRRSISFAPFAAFASFSTFESRERGGSAPR